MPPKWGHKENITFIYCTVQGSGLFKLWKSVVIRFKNINRRHDHGCTFQKFFAAELLADWIVVKGSFLNVRFIEFRVFMWLINEQFFLPTDLKNFKRIFNHWLWQSPNGGLRHAYKHDLFLFVWHCVYVVVQFYSWFKFYFPLFLGMVMYDNEFETKGNKI